jgi:cysteine desulfurase/selenocysteine lyase
MHDERTINAMAERVRGDFPLLGRNMGAHRLVFLDSASTTPKPWRVINAVSHYYASCTANVHRGVHVLGEESTRLYDAAR